MNGRQGCAGCCWRRCRCRCWHWEPRSRRSSGSASLLTDMAPLAVAYERAISRMRDSTSPLEAQANWKILLDRVIDGELDGAQMLAGQPLAAHIGIGTQAELVTAFAMDLSGNAITVANSVWAAMAPQLPRPQAGQVPPR